MYLSHVSISSIYLIYLSFSLKTPIADHRHRLTRVIKTLVTRVKESARAAKKNADKEMKRLRHDASMQQLDHSTEAMISNPILKQVKECEETFTEVGNAVWKNKCTHCNLVIFWAHYLFALEDIFSDQRRRCSMWFIELLFFYLQYPSVHVHVSFSPLSLINHFLTSLHYTSLNLSSPIGMQMAGWSSLGQSVSR